MREITFRDALREAIDEEMQRDDTVLIMGEEVAEYNGAYKITKGLLDKWGNKRVIDTPICEEGFTGLAIGAAMTGLRPIVEFMSFNFSFMAFDQIVSNAAKMYYMTGGRFSVPIVFRGCNGAAAQVSCQHSHCVEALYSHIPGLIVVAPSNAYDAKGLLKASIRNPNPVLFLENELDYGTKGEVPDTEYVLPIGKAQRIQEGRDLTVISHSRMLNYCREAVNQSKHSVELIDLRTIKPLDIATIVESVRKTHRLLIVEEGHYFSGIASEVAFQIQEICFDDLDAPMVRVCQKETPMPYAKNLEYASLPNVERIITTINQILT